MKALKKFAVALPVVFCCVLYIGVMLTGSLFQFAVMISVLVSAGFVWGPILGEWMES